MNQSSDPCPLPQLRAACLAIVLCSLPGPGRAQHHDHDAHAAHRSAATQASASSPAAAAPVVREDAELVDRQSRPVRFRQDVIGDRIVAINFIYTTCTTICPLASSIFAGLQQELGDRLGREVRLVSLSIDPSTDTPRRLSEYADRFGAAPGWLWLTGERPRMTQVLKGLGAYTPDFTSHPPMVLVGDARTDRWTRFNGLADPRQLAAEIDRLQRARTASASAPR